MHAIWWVLAYWCNRIWTARQSWKDDSTISGYCMCWEWPLCYDPLRFIQWFNDLVSAIVSMKVPHSREYQSPPVQVTFCHLDPRGTFSDTSSCIFHRSKGSIGHVFTVCNRTEIQNQASFSPFSPHEIYVLIELTLGHLRYLLTDVPPQPNSPSDFVCRTDRTVRRPIFNQKLAFYTRFSITELVKKH